MHKLTLTSAAVCQNPNPSLVRRSQGKPESLLHGTENKSPSKSLEKPPKIFDLKVFTATFLSFPALGFLTNFRTFDLPLCTPS
jgi:hypothetical protein